MLTKYPEINYKEHPAFAGLFEIYPYDDAVIETMINDIDSAVEKATKIVDIDKLTEVFEKDINKLIDTLSIYVEKKIGSLIAYELFANTIQYVKDETLKSLIRDSFKSAYKDKKCDEFQLNALQHDGMYIVHVDEKLKEELFQASRPYYERLKKRAHEHPHLRSYENVKRFSKLSRSIKKMVKEAGILDTVSNYMHIDMTIMGAGIEYSCPEHTWFKNPYPELENYHSDHYYLHLDEGAYEPKTLYYLSPVDHVEQGATQYIKGSHTASRSNFVILFQKGLDRTSADRFFKFDNSYYRPLYKNVELRKILAKFPLRLIGSSHLGDDILSNSPIANELSENTVTFFSTGTEAIVFDGGNGLHKGANVTSGERLSLQIVYKAKNEFLVNRLFKKYTFSDKAVLILRQLRGLFL